MLSLLLAASFLSAPVLDSPSPDSRFTKFEYRAFDRGALYTATVTFRKGETEVDLVSVVHIADSRYYREIQRELNSYDLVFYELVSGGAREALSSLSALQLAVGDLLHFSFQIAEINYTAPNLVHSDLSWGEIEKLSDGSPLPPVPDRDAVVKKFIPQLRLGVTEAAGYFKENPAARRSLKVFLGQLLGDIPSVLKQLNIEENREGEDILVSARNRRAMEVLKPYLHDKKRLALFWGAAHMPDFARRLKKLGFKPVRARWHMAWKIGNIPVKSWF